MGVSEASSPEQASERCERTSERTSEWPSTTVCILGCFRPECHIAIWHIVLEVFLAVKADGIVELALERVEEFVGEDDVIGLTHVEVVVFGHVVEKTRSIACANWRGIKK